MLWAEIGAFGALSLSAQLRNVQVTGRLGLSMAGAMCGTFVAAQLTMTNAELFDSAGFIALMVTVGILGFYLGTDLPRLRSSLTDPELDRPRIDSTELLSKIGAFLAAIAALISVYAFVFDETMRPGFGYMVASWWMVGCPSNRRQLDRARSSRQNSRLIVMAARRMRQSHLTECRDDS